MTERSARPPEFAEVFLVAAEESGDRLGAALMRALRDRTAGQVRFTGVGGREMAAEGVASLYPIDDLPLIGFSAMYQIHVACRIAQAMTSAYCHHRRRCG